MRSHSHQPERRCSRASTNRFKPTPARFAAARLSLSANMSSLLGRRIRIIAAVHRASAKVSVELATRCAGARSLALDLQTLTDGFCWPWSLDRPQLVPPLRTASSRTPKHTHPRCRISRLVSALWLASASRSHPLRRFTGSRTPLGPRARVRGLTYRSVAEQELVPAHRQTVAGTQTNPPRRPLHLRRSHGPQCTLIFPPERTCRSAR